MKEGRVLVLDIDGTIAKDKKPDQSYADIEPYAAMRERVIALKENGWHIILYTSRNMRTYQGSVGEILANTAPVLFDWLKRHDIPYDEIHFGKPWCGMQGFYVDDKAIRPRELLTMSLEEIHAVLERDRLGG